MTEDTLLRRVRVLETVCKFAHHPEVTKAAVRIQSVVRGRILRVDKAIFDAAVETTLRAMRGFLARRRFAEMRAACVRVQAAYRGRRVRTTPMGRLLARHADDLVHIWKLQRLVLRLTGILH